MKFFQDYSIFESMTYKANFCAQCVIEVCVYFSCQLIHGLPARVRKQICYKLIRYASCVLSDNFFKI